MALALLVRHAAPVIDPSAPSSEWVLSAEGEEAARRLARHLARPVRGPLYSSAETKAVQTASALAEEWGLRVRVEDGLREVGGRRWAASGREYEQSVSRYLRSETVDGWEGLAEAQDRVVATMRKLMRGEDALFVSHGLVLVLGLAWLLNAEPATLLPVWRTIRFPDLCIVDWEARTVPRAFGQPL